MFRHRPAEHRPQVGPLKTLFPAWKQSFLFFLIGYLVKYFSDGEYYNLTFRF